MKVLKRTLATLAGICVTAGFLVASHVPVAEAAPKAKLTFTSQRISVATPCGPYTYTLRLPVLKGGKSTIRKKLSTWSSWLRSEAAAHIRGSSEGAWCADYLRNYDITTKVEGSLYQGRYLSVMMTWREDTVGGLRTLTLDLKTGQKVALKKFASNKGGLFTSATCDAFTSVNRYLFDQFCPDGRFPQAIEGWRVSSKGIHVYGKGDDSYFFSPVIKWSKVLSPNYTKSKKKTTKNVPSTVVASCGSWKFVSAVTVQGNLVKVSDPRYKNLTYYGVKTAGKKTGGLWRVAITPHDSDPYYSTAGPGYVYFKTKNTTKAVKITHHTACDG